MSRQKIYRALGLSALMALLLTGCDLNGGGALLEVVYPSGYTRTAATWDDLTPVEGTGYQLRAEKAEDYDKTHVYDLLIVDEAGSLLYEFPGAGQTAMRGEAAESEAVWICSEWWEAAHYNGYLSGHLTRSMVLLVDMRDGTVLFQGETGKDELYLTSNETRCYFYEPGKEESEKLFGLVKIPSENAVIYYRDTVDWSERHIIYTFDYVLEPDIDTSNGVETCVKFYISEDQLKVAWTSYESIGNENWDYLEKKAYEIPLAETASE